MEKRTVLDFFSIGRTPKEIEQTLGMNEPAFLDFIKKELPEVDLFIHRNFDNQPLYVLLEKRENLELKVRIWQYRIQPDGQPYLWIQFPDDLRWDRIVVLPGADAHFGSASHDRVAFNKWLGEIKRKENTFGIIPGDALENALPDSPGGAIFDQVMRPRDQIEQFTEKIRPIAHKILWAQAGNHEARSKKRCDLDPLFYICKDLGIPYFEEPVFVNILWKGCIFSFYCQHGSTSAQTEGGKVNKAAGPLKFIDFVMFLVMAHVHDKTTNKTLKICRKRVFDEKGGIIETELLEKKQYVVICPSFYGYFGSYASRRPFAPGSRKLVAMTIFANGDYHVPC